MKEYSEYTIRMISNAWMQSFKDYCKLKPGTRWTLSHKQWTESWDNIHDG